MLSNMFSGVVVIPLVLSSSWHLESYKKISPNITNFKENLLHIQVRKSASPLVYTLAKPMKIAGFKVQGEFIGLPKFQNILFQGKINNDDYPLRIGFILQGDKNPSAIEKIFMPEWLKKIYGTLPEGTGFDHVEFYNVTQNKDELNTKRIHRASSLIVENFFELISGPKKFVFEHTLKEELDVSAIWISVDGDDTQSSFDVVINNLELRMI